MAERSIEQLLAPLLPGRPVVRLECGSVPQIREATIDAPNLGDGLYDALTGLTSRQERRGRPAHNVYVAAEVAFMRDVEGRPLLSVDRLFGVFDHVRANDLRDVTGKIIDAAEARGSVRSRRADRLRERGRAILAAHGAWPWAVVPDGGLCRSWRKDPRFAESLSMWYEASR